MNHVVRADDATDDDGDITAAAATASVAVRSASDGASNVAATVVEISDTVAAVDAASVTVAFAPDATRRLSMRSRLCTSSAAVSCRVTVLPSPLEVRATHSPIASWLPTRPSSAPSGLWS